MTMGPIVQQLLRSTEPSVCYKVRVGALGEAPDSPTSRKLRQAIKTSPRVQQLLANRREDGRIAPGCSVYRKWAGAHWILTTLADIGYPPGDASLGPAVNQVLDCWLNPEGLREWVRVKVTPANRSKGVPIIDGRARRCASQQGNALFSAVALGFVDDQAAQLMRCLIRWQWPDGGWNCDRRPAAVHSSFWESLIPLRGLARYARATGDQQAKEAADRAAEVFLQRRLFRRSRDGEVMNPQFIRLHYPCYWRYDILFALKVMAEAGYLADPRCGEALDLLESKRLPDGGWPAEERFYRVAPTAGSGSTELVDWGGVDKKNMNEWVTADALAVLRAAGRLGEDPETRC